MSGWAGDERKLGREWGVWLAYLYQKGGERPGQMGTRLQGGNQAAVLHATGVGDTRLRAFLRRLSRSGDVQPCQTEVCVV
jgi:hypothetical protein